MKNWTEDKKWSDKFLPEIKRYLGECLISEPENIKEDAFHNTDLTILELKPYRIACRIRKECYREQYGDEFTIRTYRQSGAKTELTKIIEGWGDYIFYGFAGENLTEWFIGDLKAFRLWFNSFLVINKGVLPGKRKSNPDGSSDFIAFKKSEIPNFIIAESSQDAKEMRMIA